MAAESVPESVPAEVEAPVAEVPMVEPGVEEAQPAPAPAAEVVSVESVEPEAAMSAESVPAEVHRPVAEVPAVEPGVEEAAPAPATEVVSVESADVESGSVGAVDAESVASPDPAAPSTEATGPVAHPPVPKPKSVTETGRIVEGVVTSVSDESVELTLDDGRRAVIHRRNFGLNDEEPSAIVSVGDRAFGAELAREDPKSRVVLSRAWALKRRAWEKVVEAGEKGEVVTGRVVSVSAKGLVVDVGVRGFVPSSHLELGPVADVGAYAEQSLELKILEVDPRREKLVLSRRSLLLRAQRKEMQELLHSLTPGEVRTGTVASLADYGAFVDLGGVSGLVHISELSWHRVSKPADVVSVGDQVEVKVLDVKPKKKRISLSIRQVGPDPLDGLEIGSVVVGRVTRLVDFGAFVSIGDAEGLVHLSELAEYRVISPEEVVAPGDEVGVKILSVDTKRRRIELSIRRAAEFGG